MSEDRVTPDCPRCGLMHENCHCEPLEARVAVCIYCNHRVEYERHADTEQDASNQRQAHAEMMVHDQVCPNNPLVQEIKALKLALAGDVDPLRGATLRDAIRSEFIKELGHEVGVLRTALAKYGRTLGQDGQVTAPMDPLAFMQLRVINVHRCEEVFHKLQDWSPTDWACALAGEAGEACNEVKKLRRLDGADWLEDTPEHRAALVVRIGKELADTVIYADLLAARLGIDLGAAVRDKFNEVSRRKGTNIVLPPRPWLCPSVAPCGHTQADHQCKEPNCQRGCHAHDGSDGPCDCKHKEPASA